jgi:hypothetical protein
VQARWELPCSLCGQAYGAAIQCAAARLCTAAFHPLCARAADLHMAAVPDYSASSSVSEPDDGAAEGHGEPGAAGAAADGTARAAEAAVAAGGGGGAGGEGAGRARADAGRPRRRRPARCGTTLADGWRLVCYCARNTAAAGPAGAAHAAATAAAARECAGASARPSSAAEPPVGSPNAEPGGARRAGGCEGGCARTRAFDHGLRRGERAPEALAAALAKRAFVRSVPYLVSGTRGATPLPSRCYCVVADDAAEAQTLGEGGGGAASDPAPAAAAGATRAALRLAEVPEPWASGAGGGAAARAWPAARGLQALLGPPGTSGGRQGNSTGGPPVLSLAQRMAAMRRTLARRVTCGAHLVTATRAAVLLLRVHGARGRCSVLQAGTPTWRDAAARRQWEPLSCPDAAQRRQRPPLHMGAIVVGARALPRAPVHG